MGGVLCTSSGSPLGACSCFDWCRRPFWAPIPIFIWRLIMFIVWLLYVILSLIIAVYSILFTIVGELYPFLVFFFLSGLIAFLFFFLYPELAPYLRDIVVVLINLFLELFVFAWNIGLILWNLAVQVWNAAVPLVGMLIYVFMEIFITILNNVVHFLGQINVYALFKPVMEALQSITKILVEVIQAVVSVAIPIIEVMGKVIGAIINVVFKVAEVLFPIVAWVVETLFKLLDPILPIVVKIVGWFTSIFAASSMSMHMKLLTFEEMGGRSGGMSFDRFHYDAYGAAYQSASKYWGRKSFAESKQTELGVINAFNLRNPARSFDYYWTVHRPYLSGVKYNVNIFKGVSEVKSSNGPPSKGGRHLLELAKSRQLLSEEDIKELEEPAVTFEDYWSRFEESPYKTREWHSRHHFAKEKRRYDIIERVERKLLELEDEQKLKEHVSNLDDEPLRQAAEKVREERSLDEDGEGETGGAKKHPFHGELHKKVECKSSICGGHGKPLPHPILSFRQESWKRQERVYEGSDWKDQNHTEDEWQKHRFIHITAWSQAVLDANDKFAWHMMNPLFVKHATDLWQRTTGTDSVHTWYDKFHQKPNNIYDTIHRNMWDLSELRMFKWMKERDPEKDTRMYYSDWLKYVKIQERKNKITGRKMLFVEVPDIMEHEIKHRELLDMGEEQEAEKMKIHYTHLRATIERIQSDPAQQYHADLGRRLFSEGDESEVEHSSFEFSGYDNRHLLANNFINGGLAFAPNPIPDAANISAEAMGRDQTLQTMKPKPHATVPLFQLLAETDCYTSHPRDPLCLPMLPGNWHINRTPQVTWPANATGDDFCNYLYKPIPRNLLDYRTYISWNWIWNGFQSIRIIVSALSSIGTTSIGLLASKYFFLRWLLDLLLAFPPGVSPSGIDWVCFAIYAPYSLWLLALIAFLAYTILWPLWLWLLEAIMGFLAFYTLFGAADAQLNEEMKNTDWYFYRTSVDPQTNLSHPHRAGPPPPRHRATGAEHLPSADGSQNMGSGSIIGNFPPSVQKSGAQMFTRASPYTSSAAAAAHTSRSKRNSERSNQALSALEEVLIEAAAELGMPSRLNGDRWRSSSCGWFLNIFGYFTYAMGYAGGSRVTDSHISSFERAYNPMLLSYQMSPFWLYQNWNYKKKEKKIDFYYSPVQGNYQRGCTMHTKQGIRASSTKKKTSNNSQQV